MGGIVARHSLTLIRNPASVNTLITLSTPHRLPPVTSDHLIDRVYADIAAYWSPASLLTSAHPISNTVLVSICGGSPDPTLASDACALSFEDVPSTHGLGVFTSGMVGAWTGVDHEAMVWCHQVRWRVARALLELSAVVRRGGGREERMGVATQWILGSGPASASDEGDGARSIGIDLDKTEHTTFANDLARFNSPTPHHYLFPVSASSSTSTFRLLTDLTINSVGRQAASAARVYQCETPSVSSPSLLSCLPLGARRLEPLPPSPLEGNPFRPNEGVDEKEGMALFEANVAPARTGGWIVVAADGEGWGVGELLRSVDATVQWDGMWSLLLGGIELSALGRSGSILSRVHLPNALSHSLLVYRIAVDASPACPSTSPFPCRLFSIDSF